MNNIPQSGDNPAPSHKPSEDDKSGRHENDGNTLRDAPLHQPEQDPAASRETKQEDVRSGEDAEGTKETLGIP